MSDINPIPTQAKAELLPSSYNIGLNVNLDRDDVVAIFVKERKTRYQHALREAKEALKDAEARREVHNGEVASLVAAVRESVREAFLARCRPIADAFAAVGLAVELDVAANCVHQDEAFMTIQRSLTVTAVNDGKAQWNQASVHAAAGEKVASAEYAAARANLTKAGADIKAAKSAALEAQKALAGVASGAEDRDARAAIAMYKLRQGVDGQAVIDAVLDAAREALPTV